MARSTSGNFGRHEETPGEYDPTDIDSRAECYYEVEEFMDEINEGLTQKQRSNVRVMCSFGTSNKGNKLFQSLDKFERFMLAEERYTPKTLGRSAEAKQRIEDAQGLWDNIADKSPEIRVVIIKPNISRGGYTYTILKRWK